MGECTTAARTTEENNPTLWTTQTRRTSLPPDAEKGRKIRMIGQELEDLTNFAAKPFAIHYRCGSWPPTRRGGSELPNLVQEGKIVGIRKDG
jgi:hypothetical protein